jgi:hypothetical protein
MRGGPCARLEPLEQEGHSQQARQNLAGLL